MILDLIYEFLVLLSYLSVKTCRWPLVEYRSGDSAFDAKASLLSPIGSTRPATSDDSLDREV